TSSAPTTRASTTISATGTHSGDKTAHQDQSATVPTSASFKPIKISASTPRNPIPLPLFITPLSHNRAYLPSHSPRLPCPLMEAALSLCHPTSGAPEASSPTLCAMLVFWFSSCCLLTIESRPVRIHR